MRIDGSGRALHYTIPFNAWVLQRNTEAGVSLVYRNDDGVDASTLPPIPYPYQRKRGHVFSPGFSRISLQIAQECSYQRRYPGTALRLVESMGLETADHLSLAENFRFCLCRPYSCAVSVPRHYSASHW